MQLCFRISLSKRVQKYMVDLSYEYPIVDGVMPHPSIASFGEGFKRIGLRLQIWKI